MRETREKRVRKAPLHFQAPVAILKKKTKKYQSQVKQAEAKAAANAIKRQEAIEESEQAASRRSHLGVYFFFSTPLLLLTSPSVAGSYEYAYSSSSSLTISMRRLSQYVMMWIF